MTLAHVVFLMHFRSILIVTIPLPLAVLVSFLGMSYAGVSSNIMSLAGIAIAIGVLVDAGIVVTENAFQFMEQRGVNPRDRRHVRETVRDSTRLVGRPVFFSMAIILLAFVRLCADRPGREAVPPAGVHQDVRRARRHRRGGHARPRPVQSAARRKGASGGGQPGDAGAAPWV